MNPDWGAEVWIWLFLGGFAAGIINVLAGNGSSITLGLLIFLGMPATAANLTNRIGVLVQTATSVIALPRDERTRRLLRDSRFYIAPGLIGSTLGSLLALRIDDDPMRILIGILMLVLFPTLFISSKVWNRETDPSGPRKGVGLWLGFFAMGVYAGFLQMGIGLFMLVFFVLYSRYSLVESNILKLVMALVFTIPPFLIFAFDPRLNWTVGMALAAGQALGAWIGVRYLIRLSWAKELIRWTLAVVLIVSALRLFGVF
ncbi:TSUP family transporter [bacterium]|nr:TSUP family transporter [bacterium]